MYDLPCRAGFMFIVPCIQMFSIISDTFVTGFLKIDRIVTLGLFHFIGPANGYTCTLHIHSAIIRFGWPVCFSRANFADPVNSWLRQWDTWRMLHGRHGSEIHPGDRETSITYAIQACFVLWLALVGPIASPSSPNGRFNSPPASHPPPPSAPPPSCLPNPYKVPSVKLHTVDFDKNCLKSSNVS